MRVCPLRVLREVAFWVRSREAGAGTPCQLLRVTFGPYLAGPLSHGSVRARRVIVFHVGGGRVEWALCALGPGSGRHLPTGPLEEAELQVFPDAGVSPEVLDTGGDGQVRAGMSVRVRAWGEVRLPGSLRSVA